MLRDITPYLMGDPCTAIRRAPTETEMNRHCGAGIPKYDRLTRANYDVGCTPRGSSEIRRMKVNDTVYRDTRSGARYVLMQMDSLGMRGRHQRVGERYIVERLA